MKLGNIDTDEDGQLLFLSAVGLLQDLTQDYKTQVSVSLSYPLCTASVTVSLAGWLLKADWLPFVLVFCLVA